jgi:hypothetical protein
MPVSRPQVAIPELFTLVELRNWKLKQASRAEIHSLQLPVDAVIIITATAMAMVTGMEIS